MHRFEAINVSYLLFEHKNDAKDCARAQANTHTLRYTYDEIPKKYKQKNFVLDLLDNSKPIQNAIKR